MLEIACGTGLVTWPAAEAVGQAGRIVATDIADRMVERTAAEAARRGLGHVSCRRMGAESIDEAADTFDAVLCALGLMYVPDVAAALQEAYRVLAPGGRLVAAVWGARRGCGWADIFPIVESRVKSEVCPMFFSLGTADTLAHALGAGGFGDLVAERISTALVYASAEEAADAAFAGGPVAMAYSRFDEATRDAARAEYLESIDGYRDGAGYRVPGEFVVARGTKASSD